MTYIERAALIGVGMWLGIAVTRTPFETAALPVYAIGGVMIIVARMAVVRYRETRRASNH